MSDPRAWLLGPCPCTVCHRPLGWDGVRWLELYGGPHHCPGTPPPPVPVKVETIDTPEVRAILAAVAAEYRIRVGDLQGRDRRIEYAEPRALAAYRLWSETKLTLATIGAILGGRDHSTIAFLVARHRMRAVS